MLIAKVLDKLFNRRNTFEVEALEGDITYNDISLKEVTDWVSQMKELLSYDESEDSVVLDNDVGLEISNLSYFTDYEGVSFFPDLTDQAGKFVVVKDDESGFEYADLPQPVTKLYKHTIIYEDDESIRQTAIIVSSNDSAFENKTDVEDNSQNWVMSSSAIGSGIDEKICLGLFVSEGSFVYLIKTSQIIQFIPFETFISDTVTPL